MHIKSPTMEETLKSTLHSRIMETFSPFLRFFHSSHLCEPMPQFFHLDSELLFLHSRKKLSFDYGNSHSQYMKYERTFEPWFVTLYVRVFFRCCSPVKKKKKKETYLQHGCPYYSDRHRLFSKAAAHVSIHHGIFFFPIGE